MNALVDALNQYPLRLVTVAGRVQAFREAGQGPALVLLHGISSGSGSWVNQLAALSSHFRVIAWDAPGYGDSAGLANPNPTAEDYAHALQSLLQALGVTQPLLLGHSLGAMVASAYAQAFPQHCAGLILANPAQGYGAMDADTRAEVAQKRPQLLQTLGHAGMAQVRARYLLAPEATADQIALVQHGMLRLQQQGFEQASGVLAHDDIWQLLPSVAGPVGVIYGLDDGITPPEGVEALIRRLGAKGVQAYPLPAAGHASYIDQPVAFNQAVLAYTQLINITK
ncbi:MAG: alpha/beta hydrolase [Neisseriaceae bacterium]|nr:alpha/beta hydrolase [Neisseriaceae bacterium]